MRGDFDDLRKWPLKAEMKVALVNQQCNNFEFNMELKYREPLGELVDAKKCGTRSLLSLSLDPYLRSGCLQIRIVSSIIQF